MKKTLVALAVTAFATSASAVTVYENEGSKLDVDGRVNVFLKKEASKTNKKSSKGHSDLENNGSRVRFTAKHAVNDDLSAIGRVELRFNGKNNQYDATENKNVSSYETGTAGWGNVRTHRAYLGLSSKTFGEVTFGKQLLIGDEIGLAGFDNYFGVGSSSTVAKGDSILTAAANSAVAYRYTGVEGLTFGANYNFATEHNDAKAVKNGYGVGAVYTAKLAEDQSLTASLGYTHDNYETGAKHTKDKDGVYGGLKYEVDALTVAVDGGYAVTKNNERKDSTRFVRTGAQYDVTPAVAVYGNYGYLTTKQDAKKYATAHQWMVGSQYKLHKNVKTYIEGKLDRTKLVSGTKQKDKGVGVGLAVYW